MRVVNDDHYGFAVLLASVGQAKRDACDPFRLRVVYRGWIVDSQHLRLGARRSIERHVEDRGLAGSRIPRERRRKTAIRQGPPQGGDRFALAVALWVQIKAVPGLAALLDVRRGGAGDSRAGGSLGAGAAALISCIHRRLDLVSYRSHNVIPSYPLCPPA